MARRRHCPMAALVTRRDKCGMPHGFDNVDPWRHPIVRDQYTCSRASLFVAVLKYQKIQSFLSICVQECRGGPSAKLVLLARFISRWSPSNHISRLRFVSLQKAPAIPCISVAATCAVMLLVRSSLGSDRNSTERASKATSRTHYR